MNENAPVPVTPTLPALPPDLKKQYEQLLTGMRAFGKAASDGIEVGGVCHPHLVGRVTDFRVTLYRWVEGPKKEEFDLESTSEGDIASMGLKRGVHFIFDAKGFRDPISFDAPISSFVNFSNYAASLVSRGLTLESVTTKLSSINKQFRMGSAAVLTFECLGPYEETKVIDGQFTQPPPPSAPPVQQPAARSANSIPSAWQ